MVFNKFRLLICPLDVNFENLTNKNESPYLSPNRWIIPMRVWDPVFEVFRKNKFLTASHFRFSCSYAGFIADQEFYHQNSQKCYQHWWSRWNWNQTLIYFDQSEIFIVVDDLSVDVLVIRWIFETLCDLWPRFWCNRRCFTPNIQIIIRISLAMHDEHDRAPWNDISMTF